MAQLPPALARFLCANGHHAEHVVDIGFRDADDSSIWNYALQHGAVILTKDEDFPHRLSQRGTEAPVIVWLRVGNTSRRALLEWLDPLLPHLVQMIAQGERFIEIR